MIVAFMPQSWEDYLHWRRHDRKMAIKINGFVKECRRHLFEGTGLPEPLKGELSGWWSRRTSREHRFIYRVVGQGEMQTLEIAQCRYHH